MMALKPIPAEYLQPIAQGGKVIRVDYTTNTYDETNETLQKYAYVYLPYGYDESKQYNVLYCLHGVGGEIEVFLGSDEQPGLVKLALDNMIANGDIDPIIAVSPTYYPQREDDTPRGSAAQVENFQHELIRDLIPAVEGRFSTYAETTDTAGIQASRDHRAYSGFSLGSLSTWFSFLDCVDYIHYFVPMSGDCWPKGVSSPNLTGDPEVAKAAAAWLEEVSAATEQEFFIYAVTGDKDVAGHAMEVLMDAIRTEAPSLRFGMPPEGNISFEIWPGADHDYKYMPLYYYNALPTFWQK